MAGCQPDDFVGGVEVPVLALRPASEAELESVQTQLAALAAAGIETHVADPGVHGSSMLDAERVGANVDATWAVVLDFLDRALR